MTTTLSRTSDATTSTPTLVLGYEASKTANNIFTTLIDGSVVVTAVAPGLRQGTLKLYYPSEATAWAAFAYLSVATKYRIVETAVTAVSMYFYTDGEMSIELDDATRAQWVLSVGYREVP